VISIHILQGGYKNGDKSLLDSIAKGKTSKPVNWIVPKKAQIGDMVVIFIGNFGFYATGIINSIPEKAEDWKNRYSSLINKITLLQPPISPGIILEQIPELAWARYPKNITTVDKEVADKILDIIKYRKRGDLKINEDNIESANLLELRSIALEKSRKTSKTSKISVKKGLRSIAVKLYALKREDGVCGGCKCEAPFRKENGELYLEVHHPRKLSEKGPDHPLNVIALCPNCHRQAHYSNDKEQFNKRLMNNIKLKERMFKE